MRNLVLGTALSATFALGLALGAPVNAAGERTTAQEPLDDSQQRIFAQVKGQEAPGDGNPWYDGDFGGGNSGGGDGSSGGGRGGAVVPEPGTMALLGMGLAALGAARRRQKGNKDVSA